VKEYLVVVRHAEEGGYWAEVPALDGCFAQGETVEDVLSDVRGAIASHLAALREDGQALPGESGILIATVTLPAA
jgi:predicted RNase H-like HicB family nuclease